MACRRDALDPRGAPGVARRPGAWYDSDVRRPLAPFALLLCLAPAAARAAEGEKALSIVPTYAVWAVTQQDGTRLETVEAQGGQLGLDYERGYNDTLWLRASVAGGLYSTPDGLGWSGGATVGITYAFDVLRYVPYLNLGAGAIWVAGDGIDSGLKPVVELGVGVDVLESRTFSWGVVLRFDSFASQVAFFTIGPRISWRWGFF